MTTLADVIAHQDACADCTTREPCPVAHRMFAAARDAIAARFEPPKARAFEVIDLAAHQANCTRCGRYSLCSVARTIADRAGTAIRDTGRRMVSA